MPMLAPMRALTASSTNGSASVAVSPLRDRRRVVGVGVEQHDRELVAAEPDERVAALAAARGSARPELAQQFVAGRMAERVVDLLEAVEVDEQKRQARLAQRAGRR